MAILFLSLYLITMGGHTSSPDEESMYYVTKSLTEHGGLDVPAGPEATIAGSFQGVDGKYYAAYGVIPSVMAVPFYAAGDSLASGLGLRFHGFVTRLAVNLLDPVVTALSVALVYLFGLRFGYSNRLSVLIAFVFGATTIAWPYSKYFWSEPVTGFWLLLSALCACISVQHRRSSWALLSGITLGLAIGSKVFTALVVPAFLLYLLLGGSTPRSSVQRAKDGLIHFVAGLAVVGLCLLWVNYIRYGDPIQTGYMASSQASSVIRIFDWSGIAGLLFSPGKSVFLYSPVALLGLFGLALLRSRYPGESALFAFVFAVHVLFYGLAVFWHGDASWGPRYLVPVTAFLVLPIGAALEGVQGTLKVLTRIAFTLLALVGLLVQIGGVLVNYDAYTIQTIRAEDQRRWNPSMSPIIAHAAMLTSRVQAFGEWDRAEVVIGNGFLTSESKNHLFPRWISDRATLVLWSPSALPVRVVVTYQDHRPQELGPAVISVSANGKPTPIHPLAAGPDGRSQSFAVLIDHPQMVDSADIESINIVISSTTWVPTQHTKSQDDRILGILVTDIRLESAGRLLTLGEDYVPHLPVWDWNPWSKTAMAWFYDPQGHLADVWMWYIAYSGLDRSLVSLVFIPVAGLVISTGYLVLLVATDRERVKQSNATCVTTGIADQSS